jgi:hypothetical protein
VIYHSACKQNVVLWSQENLHFTLEVENNPTHIMLWAGVTANHFSGPYVSEGPVKGTTYPVMLWNWLIHELMNRGIMEQVWFQHNGASAHFMLTAHDVLQDNFPGWWIGRGSPTSSPLPWPPRGPDLTTLNSSLWGFIKGKVVANQYNTNNEL